jgi:hypothetical protein
MQRKTEPDLEALDPDVEALFASARSTPRLPSTTRARAVARARAFVAATTASAIDVDTPLQRSWLRFAFAVCIVLASGVVGAALGALIALHSRAPDASGPAPSLEDETRATGMASAVSSRRTQ